VLLAAVGTGAACGSPAVSAVAKPSPSKVPITILGGQGTLAGARPTVEVKVGNSSPVPVLLDTGSSGLHLFGSAIPTGPGSGVTLTSEPANITYSGGHRFVGVVATAVVTLGAAATSVPVRFADVERAFCIAGKPTCPAAGGIPGFEAMGVDGILGIGTQSSGGDLVSPIFGLPGSLGSTWSIHLTASSGTLILGARLPTGRSVTTVPMRPVGSSVTPALWADSRLPLCLSVGAVDQCVHGLFDSGTYTMQISGAELSRAPTTTGSDHVIVGTPVAVTLGGSANPFWSFTAGATKSKDLVTVRAGRGGFVNSGVQVFYDFTVTYDDTSGQIRLSH
jgi:Protein of unknown function (DUF3443)